MPGVNCTVSPTTVTVTRSEVVPRPETADSSTGWDPGPAAAGTATWNSTVLDAPGARRPKSADAGSTVQPCGTAAVSLPVTARSAWLETFAVSVTLSPGEAKAPPASTTSGEVDGGAAASSSISDSEVPPVNVSR